MENLTFLTLNPIKSLPNPRLVTNNFFQLLDSLSMSEYWREIFRHVGPSFYLHLFFFAQSTFKFKLQMLLNNIHLNKKIPLLKGT